MKEHKLEVEVQDSDSRMPYPTDENGNQLRGFRIHEKFYRFISEEPNEHILWYFERMAEGLVCGIGDTNVGYKLFDITLRELE